ncbi:hypothetical protein P879_10484 [Paragonimus westermani]|uniref:Uncharacterized protein n=1 Tax=Paragonimus westermani TaxID=34504 RepID=A0A8T0DD17_9TREM|nr:hypothetical protein P879_10484 [Paragonimus westermani]
MPLCKSLPAKSFAISPIGDSPTESGLTDLSENATTFFIGENASIKEIPAHIRERLESKNDPKLNFAERQKQRDLRMQSFLADTRQEDKGELVSFGGQIDVVRCCRSQQQSIFEASLCFIDFLASNRRSYGHPPYYRDNWIGQLRNYRF